MKRIKTKYEILRQEIYIIIYGDNTVLGRLFNLSLLVVIFLSVILIMLDSMKGIGQKYHDFFYVLEWIVTIFFTIEYILRIISNKNPKKYIFSFYGIIDLIATLPMYLSFIIPSTAFLVAFRALRLLRLFAILNLMPIIGQQSHLKEALIASKNKIIVFIYFIAVVSIVLGTVMYLVEGPHNGFENIPTSIYWCIVTLTTVGYGDIAPVTHLGQLIASFIMIMGYGIIAVPTGIVTAEYSKASRINPELEDKKTCPNCSRFIYEDDAKFCSVCGTNLENEQK